jgi:hypothetical protein
MQRLTILTHFRGRAAEPSGEPPQTDPRASSVSVELVEDDGSVDRIEHASYQNHAVFTGESTFAETGCIRYDDGGELQITTLSDGTLGPSVQPDVLHGAALYRITGGSGRFDGASGLITSNFLLHPATGEFEERQVTVVFLPD